MSRSLLHTHRTWPVVLLIAALILIPQIQGKVDPETKKVRLVLFGEGWSFIPSVMMTDPKITAITIPAGDATYARDMARFMRIYMPRTYDDWVNRVDVFVLSDLVPWGFTDDQFFWMKRSIEKEGVGMILSEMGWYGITGWTGNACEDWTKTVLYDAYPCDMILEKENEDCPYLDIVTSGPFLDLPGIEQVAFALEQGLHVPREGATTWAVYRKGREAAIITRPYGKGMTVANSMGIERFGQPYYEWKYYKDYFINHAYMAANLRLPEDLEQVHRIREQLETFRDRRAYVIGMIDFIDKFGANTRPVEKMLGETMPLRKKAEELYLEQRYDKTSEVIAQAMDRFDEIDAKAVKLRNQALMWVYIIEWSAVSATSLLAGFVLWALMVRRRLYREVSITRSTGR